ncbi:MAG: hypothetical protein CL926_12995 [Deltaproteobacteria bacterium]|nr:hypothetical protein [Deltaproteobacteria bacterium]|tara:strand:+ start:318 stop:500 length:183 start_codon:yes stop_codon:yes gene_type:complete
MDQITLTTLYNGSGSRPVNDAISALIVVEAWVKIYFGDKGNCRVEDVLVQYNSRSTIGFV